LSPPILWGLARQFAARYYYIMVLMGGIDSISQSDKPAAREDYSYERQVNWMSELVVAINMDGYSCLCWKTALSFSDVCVFFLYVSRAGITAFVQDWGGLIGLRMATRYPERFLRLVVSNTGLPRGGVVLPVFIYYFIFVLCFIWCGNCQGSLNAVCAAFPNRFGSESAVLLTRGDKAFVQWATVVSQQLPEWGLLIQNAVARDLDDEEVAAYDAPFPDESFKGNVFSLAWIGPCLKYLANPHTLSWSGVARVASFGSRQVHFPPPL
jgi:haloalkane dehalogenase